MMKHRGEIVEKAVRASGYSITTLAQRLGKSRRWIYHAFENRDLPVEMILTIGSIIHHDFSVEISELIKYKDQTDTQLLNEPKKQYDTKKDEGIFWKDKYLDLLEKYNKLLLEINQKISGKTPPAKRKKKR